VRTAALTSG